MAYEITEKTGFVLFDENTRRYFCPAAKHGSCEFPINAYLFNTRQYAEKYQKIFLDGKFSRIFAIRIKTEITRTVELRLTSF